MYVAEKRKYIRVDIDFGQLDRFQMLLEVSPRVVNRAAVRAINRTLTHARTLVARVAKDTYTLKAKTVRDKINIASRPQKGAAFPYGTIQITGRGIPLVEYQHKPRKLTSELRRRPKHGVAVRVLRKGGYHQVSGAFKAMGGSGRAYIGWRARRGGRPVPRYPVHQLYGPSMRAIGRKALAQSERAIINFLDQRFQVSLQHALQEMRK